MISPIPVLRGRLATNQPRGGEGCLSRRSIRISTTLVGGTDAGEEQAGRRLDETMIDNLM